MEIKLYSIYDSAAGCYMRPFCAHADGHAMRMFSDIAKDLKHEIGRHPKDYTLFKLGEFDDSNGKLTALLSPNSMVNALELVSKDLEGQPEEILKSVSRDDEEKRVLNLKGQ